MPTSTRTLRSAPLVPKARGRESPSLTVMTGQGHNMQKFDLTSDESLTIGTCGCLACGNRLVLPTRVGLGFQARLTARSQAWTATNLSPDLDLWCIDLEDPTQQVRVGPQRAEMFVPFEFTGLEFRLHGIALATPVRVIANEPPTTTAGAPCLVMPHANRARRLRRGTVYMAVLEELVAATKRCGTPPSSDEISEGLNRRGIALSRKAVDRHIDYLGDRLLPEGSDTLHRGWKRAALAVIAQRARLVDVQEGSR